MHVHMPASLPYAELPAVSVGGMPACNVHNALASITHEKGSKGIGQSSCAVVTSRTQQMIVGEQGKAFEAQNLYSQL